MSIRGTIFDLKKFAIHDGPGIRTTVFLKGCPLDCLWCHNPEGLNPYPETFTVQKGGGGPEPNRTKRQEVVGREVTAAEVMEEIEKDVIFYEQSGGGVTFSGGEPLQQEEFLTELLERCAERRIHTAVDTSGFTYWETLERIARLADLILYDLKIMDEREHVRYTGVFNKLVLDNLANLSRTGACVIVRVPLIPGITDTDDNLRAVAGFVEPLANIREVDLLPYNKFSEDKLRKFQMTSRIGRFQPQTEDDLTRKADLFRSRGLEVKIGG